MFNWTFYSMSYIKHKFLDSGIRYKPTTKLFVGFALLRLRLRLRHLCEFKFNTRLETVHSRTNQTKIALLGAKNYFKAQTKILISVLLNSILIFCLLTQRFTMT